VKIYVMNSSVSLWNKRLASFSYKRWTDTSKLKAVLCYELSNLDIESTQSIQSLLPLIEITTLHPDSPSTLYKFPSIYFWSLLASTLNVSCDIKYIDTYPSSRWWILSHKSNISKTINCLLFDKYVVPLVDVLNDLEIPHKWKRTFSSYCYSLYKSNINKTKLTPIVEWLFRNYLGLNQDFSRWLKKWLWSNSSPILSDFISSELSKIKNKRLSKEDSSMIVFHWNEIRKIFYKDFESSLDRFDFNSLSFHKFESLLYSSFQNALIQFFSSYSENYWNSISRESLDVDPLMPRFLPESIDDYWENRIRSLSSILDDELLGNDFFLFYCDSVLSLQSKVKFELGHFEDSNEKSLALHYTSEWFELAWSSVSHDDAFSLLLNDLESYSLSTYSWWIMNLINCIGCRFEIWSTRGVKDLFAKILLSYINEYSASLWVWWQEKLHSLLSLVYKQKVIWDNIVWLELWEEIPVYNDNIVYSLAEVISFWKDYIPKIENSLLNPLVYS